MTAKLFTAVKTAYLRECSGLVRNNGKCQPVTVDMMAQLLNGRQVDKLHVAEGTDTNKVIDLMEGYSCGLASLPRIYKQVARLAGETCEKIAVYQDALQPYGFDYEAAANKDNKKVVAVIKKYCKVDDLRPYIGVVYHDAERHNAVWTDAQIMIVSKALYNPAAAGRCVDANGLELEGYRYPNYAAVVPDFSTCYRFNGADVVANCTESLATAKSLKKANGNRDEYDIFNAGMVEGRPACFNVNFLPFFKLIESPMYILPDSHKMAGYLHHGDGFILMMPINKKAAEESHLDEKTVYLQEETRIARRVETAAAGGSANLAAYLTTAADADTQAPAEVEKVEKEETPAAAPCVAMVPVAVAAEVEKEETPTPAEDAAVLVDAAAIRCYYSSMAASCQPLPPVDAYEVETLADNTAIIRCRRRDAAVLVAVSGPRNYSHSVIDINSGKTVTAFAYSTAQYTQAEAMAAAIHSAIKHIDTLPVVDGYDTQADTAADTLPDPPAVVTVSAPYPPVPRRRRFVPRLRPVLHRLGRVAAVVLPLLLVALFIGASTASAPAADAETVAQVIDLPAVTVTAEAPDTFIENEAPCLIEDKAPRLIEDKAPAPSPVKNVAEAAECSSQKTDAADSPAGEKTASPMATATDAAGLTICEGTPWAYTMMNWA